MLSGKRSADQNECDDNLQKLCSSSFGRLGKSKSLCILNPLALSERDGSASRELLSADNTIAKLGKGLQINPS